MPCAPGICGSRGCVGHGVLHIPAYSLFHAAARRRRGARRGPGARGGRAGVGRPRVGAAAACLRGGGRARGASGDWRRMCCSPIGMRRPALTGGRRSVARRRSWSWRRWWWSRRAPMAAAILWRDRRDRRAASSGYRDDAHRGRRYDGRRGCVRGRVPGSAHASRRLVADRCRARERGTRRPCDVRRWPATRARRSCCVGLARTWASSCDGARPAPWPFASTSVAVRASLAADGHVASRPGGRL